MSLSSNSWMLYAIPNLVTPVEVEVEAEVVEIRCLDIYIIFYIIFGAKKS